MQRRLFLIFLMLAFLPATAILLLNWRMSQRHLGYLDSPGLIRSQESGLELARFALEREKAVTVAITREFARELTAGHGAMALPTGAAWSIRLAPATALTDSSPRGGSAEDHDPSRALPSPPAGGDLNPFLAFPALGPPRVGEAVRTALADENWLVSETDLDWQGQPARLRLALPLDPELKARLDAAVRDGSRARQLRLYYSDLLRGDTLLTLSLLGVLLLAASLWLSRRLARQVARPLKQLVKDTEIVARGNLEHRVDIEAPAELGELVVAFNRMTGDLEANRRDLLRAERVAAWQGIARRLAHEIKNPLTPINLALHRIDKRSEDATVSECVEAALEETDNLQRLADEFAQFARLPAPTPEPVDLVDLLQGVCDLYLDAERFQQRWRDWPDRLELAVDPGQLRQVFANLIKNAAEAMGEKGTLTLALESGAGGAWAVILQDTGPGFDRAPEELFEPYITSKATGTGLGLAIARRIVEDHGGRLSAAPGPAGGAWFRVELPGAGFEPERNKEEA